jgi:uncharacterized RDD family membrane protein YckC
MLCQRCSHPLPPLADRCLRCFALNPREPGPAFSIESDPPPPAAVQLAGGPGGIAWHAAAEDLPDTATTDRFAVPAVRPTWTPVPPGNEPSTSIPTPTSTTTPISTPPATAARSETPPATAAGSETPNLPAAPLPARPTTSAQLLAWSVDLTVVLACASLHVAVAILLLHRARGPASDELDLLLRGPRLPALWGALCALVAVAYSWLFTALGGRTPGLALAGLRIESRRGGTLTIGEALARALLAVLSAALGLAGFALALVDLRGQTLHDKLCGAVVVRRRPAITGLLPGRGAP